VLTDRCVRRVAVHVAGFALLLSGLVTGCSSADNEEPSNAETLVSDAPPARLRPMEQPTKPFQLTKLPKQTGSTELASIAHGLKKIAWVSLGAIPGSTSSDCSVSNTDLLAIKEKGSKSFTCDVVTGTKKRAGEGSSKKTTIAGKTTTRFTVRATRRGSTIDWTYSARSLPVLRAKLQHEIARQADDPARVTCLGEATVLLRVGDPDAVHCVVTHPDNTQTSYFGGLDTKGALSFATAQDLERS
jgi:hypothetical protein